MTRPLTVRDRDGNLVERADGVMLDGDKVQGIRVPMLFADSAGGASVSPATLASARLIMGDGYVEADYHGLTDTAARYAVVRKRLGDVANGRPAPFMDAAWNTLAGTTGTSSPAVEQVAPAMPVLTDAQKAFAADAVKRAMADRAGPAAVQDSARAVADGAKAARNHLMCDAWKSDGQRAEEAILDGLSYTERMAVQSGSPASYVKASERKVSDAVFYDRQRQYRARQERSA